MIGLTNITSIPILTTWNPLSLQQEIDLHQSIQAFSLPHRIMSPHFFERNKDKKEKLEASLHLIKSCDSISHIFIEKVSVRLCKAICLIEFSNLKDLLIPHNNIHSIEWIFCLHAINLTKLDLSRNKIVCIRSIVKANIPALEDINLGTDDLNQARTTYLTEGPEKFQICQTELEFQSKLIIKRKYIKRILGKCFLNYRQNQPNSLVTICLNLVNLPREDIIISNKDLYEEVISKRFYDSIDNWEVFEEDFTNSEFEVSENEEDEDLDSQGLRSSD